ncbi:glycosyl hydrolase domain protein [Ranid herpesvirus 3]|uniref:Glycosyl hydrolase domain protein n=1 Tax=Ranid herpesvirus 3 TaxID=1987509 RepID=A0A1X9T5B4_9VIRU|nr:glycosyl hydrolase domain protein [Ranid herpesvirus 3]ARR28892.1 glycosyl hydrolase domain protein [Ranid herpesvirus 3]
MEQQSLSYKGQGKGCKTLPIRPFSKRLYTAKYNRGSTLAICNVSQRRAIFWHLHLFIAQHSQYLHDPGESRNVFSGLWVKKISNVFLCCEHALPNFDWP